MRMPRGWSSSPAARPLEALARLGGVGLLFAACGLLACGGSPPEKARDEITLATNSSLSSAVEHIAQDGGYFAEEGLEVEFVLWQRGGAALPLLAGGELDVAVTAPLNPRYFNVIGRGGRLRLVAARAVYDPEACAYAAYVARPELIASGRLTGPESLRGLRLGGSRSGTTTYSWHRMLATGGLTPEEVEMLNVPNEAELQAFESDELDVATASEPWTSRLVRSGHAVVWRKVADVLPHRQSTFLLFGSRLLDERRDLGVRFLRAYLKAARAYREQGRTERYLEIVAARTRMDRAELLEMCWPPWSEDGRVDPLTLSEYQEWALEQGLIDTVVPFDGLVEEWFLDQVEQSGAPG